MLDIMREADLFEGVSENVLREIARESEEVTFEKDSVIYHAGEASSHIYKLIEGSVDLVMMERHVVHLMVTPTGQIFGWSALVQPYTRMATAKCTAPTKVVRMSRDSIERIIENHPHEGLTILKNLARIVTHRLRDAYTYIHYYGKPDTP
jgi:CRP-like cAMP-binding protein